MYSLSKNINVTPAAKYEFHVCPLQKCCEVFPDLSKELWEQHRHDVCQACFLGRRFRPGGGVLIPSKRCARAAFRGFHARHMDCSSACTHEWHGMLCSGWYIPVEEIVQQWCSDPVLGQHILNQEHRTTDDPETFFGSPAYRQLDEDLGGALSNPNIRTLLLTGGLDGVQLLTFGKRSATIFGVQLRELPPHLVQTAGAVRICIVVEGRHEPHRLNSIFKRFVSCIDDNGRALLLSHSHEWGPC